MTVITGTPETLPFDGSVAFKRRFEALLNGPLSNYRQKFDESTDPQHQALCQLIDDFASFAEAYFNHFLSIDVPQRRREAVPNALRLLQQEADLLARVGQQRLLDAFMPFLEQADQRARHIYAQFHGYKPRPDLVPVIYVEKLFSIRRCVYSKRGAPLLAVPLFVLNDSSLQEGSLAHELGHYIYGNASKLESFSKTRQQVESAVLKALKIEGSSFNSFTQEVSRIQLWLGWSEEVFADVCGALLLGPRYVITAWRRIEEEGEMLAAHDREHPCAYLRPLIAIEALAWVAQQHEGYAASYPEQCQYLGRLVEQFRAHWEQIAEQARKEGLPGLRIELRSLEVLARPIVQTLLGDPAGWVKRDGLSSISLGALFDSQAWLQRLPELSLPKLNGADWAFDYEPWLQHLPSLDGAGTGGAVLGDTSEGSLLPLYPDENRPGKLQRTTQPSEPETSPFDDLTAEMKRLHGEDHEQLSRALLQLDFGEDRGVGRDYYIGYLTDVGWGNGNYVKG